MSPKTEKIISDINEARKVLQQRYHQAES